MIPLFKESNETLADRRASNVPLERCVFCSTPAATWHENTNNPICVKCAKTKKVSDIPNDHGRNIRKMKRKGTYIRDYKQRAN